MAGIQLRDATAADKAALFAIHKALFREQIARAWGWDDASQRRIFEKEWCEVETLVIGESPQLAGYLQKQRHPDHLYVLSLGLLPEFQGRGWGGEVISLLKDEATASGIGIRLSVFRWNERALLLYLRHGFRIGETTDSSHRLVWDPPSSTAR